LFAGAGAVNKSAAVTKVVRKPLSAKRKGRSTQPGRPLTKQESKALVNRAVDRLPNGTAGNDDEAGTPRQLGRPSTAETDERERPFACTYCDKRFLCGGHLKDHMIIHTGIYPHTCDACGAGFR
jgi:hypothetical protein